MEVFSTDHLAYYIMICLIAAATPGPGTLAVVNNALDQGFKKTLPLMLGIVFGLGIIGIITISGQSTLIIHSSMAFSIIKYVGGVYIGYMGILGLFSAMKRQTNNHQQHAVKKKMSFNTGAVLSIFNPKTFVFFTALLPSFVLQTGSPTQQTMLLTAILLLCTFSVHLVYAALCGLVSKAFQEYMIWIDGMTGFVFIAFSFVILFTL